MNDDGKTTLLDMFLSNYTDLLKYVTRRLGKASDANDVVHDTFFRIRSLTVEAEIKNPKAYLFRVANSQMIDYLRRGRSRERYIIADSSYDAVDGRPSPERSADYKGRLELLQRAIANLPARQKEVFLMHKFDGLRHAEIAVRLNISRSAVEKLLIKAMANLRDALGDVID